MLRTATNPWGSGGTNGLEPQRNDLWTVDLSEVLHGLTTGPSPAADQLEYTSMFVHFQNEALRLDPMTRDITMLKYFATSIALPELTISPEVVRRDSKNYQAPGWDVQPGPIRISFVHDISYIKPSGLEGPRRSEIYTFLNLWRTLVRAGRGGMSSEFAIVLDKNYRVNYGFNVKLNFLGGMDIRVIKGDPKKEIVPKISALEMTSSYTLVNCWISTLGLGPEISTEGSRFLQVQASFYADDIVPYDIVPKLRAKK